MIKWSLSKAGHCRLDMVILQGKALFLVPLIAKKMDLEIAY